MSNPDDTDPFDDALRAWADDPAHNVRFKIFHDYERLRSQYMLDRTPKDFDKPGIDHSASVKFGNASWPLTLYPFGDARVLELNFKCRWRSYGVTPKHRWLQNIRVSMEVHHFGFPDNQKCSVHVSVTAVRPGYASVDCSEPMVNIELEWRVEPNSFRNREMIGTPSIRIIGDDAKIFGLTPSLCRPDQLPKIGEKAQVCARTTPW